MGNTTNTSNAFYSSYRVGVIEGNKARGYRIAANAKASPPPSSISIDYIIILYNLCKRHGIEVDKAITHPRTQREATQNIKAMRQRLKGVASKKVLKVETNMLYEALRRKQDGKH